MSYSSYPGGPNQSSYPGGPNQSFYPGGPPPQSSHPGGSQSSYLGGPQSSYPGADYSQPPSAGGYGSPHLSAGGHASSHHDQSGYQSPTPYGQQQQCGQSAYPGQQQPVQYDEHGNPLPEGERGLGAMALGAAGGWAGNKMTGGHLGGFTSLAGGAFAGQLLSKLGDKNKHGSGHGHNPYGQQGYGAQNHNQGGLGGLGSFFGKK